MFLNIVCSSKDLARLFLITLFLALQLQPTGLSAEEALVAVLAHILALVWGKCYTEASVALSPMCLMLDFPSFFCLL